MKELDFSFKDILDVEQRQGGKIRRGKITIPAKVIKTKLSCLKFFFNSFDVIIFVPKIDIKSELRFSLCKETMHHVLKKM